MYDVAIVGAGAAGLTAAIYAGRKKLKTVLITGPNIGGETNSTNDIRNYPGYEGSGPELMKKFWEQAKTWGAEVIEDKVGNIKHTKHFTLTLSNGKQLEAKNIVVIFVRESPANDGYEGGHILYKNIGSGEMLFFKNGQVVEGTWSKETDEDQIKFFDNNGRGVSNVQNSIS